ncbi:MAG TPA: YncE family protein [Nitriliruptorales bacterium]|nr:YncE family protein [Nitriliruptorales bacterium]
MPTGQRPHDLRIGPDGHLCHRLAWSVARAIAGGELRGSIELGAESHHLAFTPDGSELWVTDHAVRRVHVMDTAALQVAATLAVRGAAHHVAITPDGELAAVADHTGGAIAVFDVAGRAERAVIPVGAGRGPTGCGPCHEAAGSGDGVGRERRTPGRGSHPSRGHRGGHGGSVTQPPTCRDLQRLDGGFARKTSPSGELRP